MSSYRDLCVEEPYRPYRRMLLRWLIKSMETENTCRCSTEALRVMTDLRNLHTVVELETVLDLVDRIYTRGQAILKCKDCRATPQASFVPISTLAEQSLSLLEAVCLAYGITRQNSLFDAGILAFEQPLPQFICIRSKVQLGEADIDEDEAGLLVRLLLAHNLMRLLELLEALQEVIRSLCKDNHNTPGLRGGSASLRVCESSLNSTIHRLAMFMEQIEGDRGKVVTFLSRRA